MLFDMRYNSRKHPQLLFSLIIALIQINAIKAKPIEVKGLSPATATSVNNHSIDPSLNMIHFV